LRGIDEPMASMFLSELMPLLSTAASLVGGGAIITAVLNQVAARHQRRIDALRSELQEFYGPLGFLAATTRMLSDHRSKLVTTAMLTASQPTEDQDVRIKRGFEAGKTSEIGDDFNRRIVACNREIHALLRKQYHLIEPADLALFHSVMIDLERMEVECAEGYMKLPIWAYAEAGILLYTRPEFTDRIKARLDERQRLLRHLGLPYWRRRFNRP
jgi:hypothetical protein